MNGMTFFKRSYRINRLLSSFAFKGVKKTKILERKDIYFEKKYKNKLPQKGHD